MLSFCDRFQGLDSFLCLVLFFPSMMFFWRGIWDLYGVYIFPNDSPRFEWTTAGLGACSIVGYFAYPLLSHCLQKIHSKVLRFVVVRLSMYAFGVLNMANWRGVWGVADVYLLRFGWRCLIVELFLCSSFLLVMRCSRSIVFPPFVVVLDTRDDVLVPSTCFQTQVKWREARSVLRYSLDSLFTQYLILTASIFLWRSALTLVEIYFIPTDYHLSNLVSAGIGVAGTVLLFALETPLSLFGVYIQTRCGHWALPRLVYEDIVYLVVFVVEVFLWRGTWNLNCIYIIADPMVGGWVNHAVGLVLLMSLQLMSYVAGCGCSLDGRDSDSREAIFSTKYVRTYAPIVSQWISRKKIRQQETDLEDEETSA